MARPTVTLSCSIVSPSAACRLLFTSLYASIHSINRYMIEYIHVHHACTQTLQCCCRHTQPHEYPTDNVITIHRQAAAATPESMHIRSCVHTYACLLCCCSKASTNCYCCCEFVSVILSLAHSPFAHSLNTRLRIGESSV